MNTIPPIFWSVPAASVAALLFAYGFYVRMKRESEGTERMREIAGYVRKGAMAYLRQQYKVVSIVFVVLALFFAWLAYGVGVQNPWVPFAFLTGGFFSALAGFFGMKTATYASARTAHAARQSLDRGLKVAFRSGAVMGLVVVGLGLLDISLWYVALNYFIEADGSQKLVMITTTMLTFGMGASTQALFARVGGGIYTKAADMGADLVGKTEANIPEDDPRNPATIADNVGDNVGDVAGLGSDLLESYVGAISSGIILAYHMFLQSGALGTGMTETMLQKCILFPLVFVSLGLLACCIGIGWLLAKRHLSENPRLELNGATYVAALLTIILGFLASWFLFKGEDAAVLKASLGFAAGSISPWIASTIGVVAGVVIGMLAEYYTSADYRPTRLLANTATEGAALTITQGLALGMRSCMAPCVVLGAGIVTSYAVSGMYGVSMAAMGMLSFVTATVSVDTYGPISDNAGGIAEMSELDPEVRKITDTLDSVGNTTAAIGKGFAIGSGALAALALMISYLYSFNEVGTGLILNLMEPMVLAGAIAGGALPFLFSGMLIEAVAKAARKMVDEVRRQFREIPGILEGKAKPDYKTCISISYKGAIDEMKAPSLLAIVVPVATGFLFGPSFVGGLIIGSTLAAIMIAIFCGNAGGAWDNGKKYIEAGGVAGAGKGTPTHSAAVVGDTVGDPLKDTVGPCLDIFIKIMSTVSLVASPVFAQYNLVGWIQSLLK